MKKTHKGFQYPYLHFMLLTFMLLLNQHLNAQELSVKSMEILPNDATARSYDYRFQDTNGEYAGIVKVHVALSGVEFEGGGVLKQEKRGIGEYWVWLAKDSSRLKVRATGFLPLEINFRAYEGVNVIHPQTTYKLILTIPVMGHLQQEGNTSNSVDNSATYVNKSFTVKGVSFTMVYVEGGTFTMGATSEQGSDVRNNEKPTHSVTLNGFYIGETEVTQELWKAVMGRNPSSFKSNANLPVEVVSWEDCQMFINKLNSLTGQQFKLPTEAQWEYAARGGNKSRGYMFCGGNDIDSVAWQMDNSDGAPHPVKSKFPNELGIYDMSGNVYEWCSDWYGDYSSSTQNNPIGPFSGVRRVIRGGGWGSHASVCRPAYRSSWPPTYRYVDIGFRLVL